MYTIFQTWTLEHCTCGTSRDDGEYVSSYRNTANSICWTPTLRAVDSNLQWFAFCRNALRKAGLSAWVLWNILMVPNVEHVATRPRSNSTYQRADLLLSGAVFFARAVYTWSRTLTGWAQPIYSEQFFKVRTTWEIYNRTRTLRVDLIDFIEATAEISTNLQTAHWEQVRVAMENTASQKDRALWIKQTQIACESSSQPCYVKWLESAKLQKLQGWTVQWGEIFLFQLISTRSERQREEHATGSSEKKIPTNKVQQIAESTSHSMHLAVGGCCSWIIRNDARGNQLQQRKLTVHWLHFSGCLPAGLHDYHCFDHFHL